MLKTILKSLVKAYSFAISPLLGPSCRFEPTCSCYAHDALEKHGAVKGVYLTLKRLCKCHPFNKSDRYDPVP